MSAETKSTRFRESVLATGGCNASWAGLATGITSLSGSFSVHIIEQTCERVISRGGFGCGVPRTVHIEEERFRIPCVKVGPLGQDGSTGGLLLSGPNIPESVDIRVVHPENRVGRGEELTHQAANRGVGPIMRLRLKDTFPRGLFMIRRRIACEVQLRWGRWR